MYELGFEYGLYLVWAITLLIAFTSGKYMVTRRTRKSKSKK
jgi:hypothetical protein